MLIDAGSSGTAALKHCVNENCSKAHHGKAAQSWQTLGGNSKTHQKRLLKFKQPDFTTATDSEIEWVDGPKTCCGRNQKWKNPANSLELHHHLPLSHQIMAMGKILAIAG